MRKKEDLAPRCDLSRKDLSLTIGCVFSDEFCLNIQYW